MCSKIVYKNAKICFLSFFFPILEFRDFQTIQILLVVTGYSFYISRCLVDIRVEQKAGHR